ncbi:SIR2 family protein [candidate division KSB1 bacterium]|nr:SIR2 family protein [candidate division KSB1 bacterium]
MPSHLDDRDWNMLLTRIKSGKCTPFLGAGACAGTLPLGSDIAKQWALEHDYPLKNDIDLVRVAQYIAVEVDPMFPKENLIELFEKKIAQDGPPNFSDDYEPHGVLADLPLPVYMTTNYDDFMVHALTSKNWKPRRELCKWNTFIADYPSVWENESSYEPTPENPVVFHLHGHNEVPESIVLTEDDYLDFLVNISKDQKLLPPRIQRAITGTSLLFIGYSLSDWSFRVLFRGLIASTERSLRRLSISVQLPPITTNVSEDENARIQQYLDEYFKNIDIKVYWGTTSEFTRELRRRWEAFKDGA